MKWENQLIEHLQWSNEIINRVSKERVARKVAEFAQEGDVIGAGSGSTVYPTLLALVERIHKELLHIEVIPASLETSMTCVQLGIPQTTLWDKRPDWSFDGADEVDPQHNLIKGRGGAMFKEKLLIKSSDKCYIIIDESKTVEHLGSNFPIPVEVFPGALPFVEYEMRQLGASEINLRLADGKDGPVLTENGNLILDVRFETIYASLGEKLKAITGVIETGLFIGYEVEVIKAAADEDLE
ncbi:MAG: ribose 5-phosphate isomerase A [Bacteroides sp.]|nr:ribose 5-phosphate isomerase A [Bacteroides sp.]